MKDKVTIIVPVYNAEKYLEKCIKSLINQTYNNLEIILIDDGSLDRSWNICNKFAKKDTRIKAYHKENGGVSSARNWGLSNSSGKYILFVDSDDWLENNMIEILYREIEEQKVDVSICNFFCNDEKSQKINDKTNNKIISDDRKEKIKYLFEESLFGGYLWNKLIRKSIIGDIVFDENVKICEDILFLYEIFKKESVKIYYDSLNILYHYRKSETSAVNFNCSEKDLTKLIPLKYFLKDKIICDKVLPDYFRLLCQGIYINQKEKKYLESKKMKEEAKKYLNDIIKMENGLIKIKLLLWYFFPNICGYLKEKN